MPIKESAQVAGHRVLLQPEFIEETTEWGFKLDIGDTYKREKAATVVGKVISIGPMAWRAFDGQDPNWQPWCKVGDTVFFAKFAGKFITLNEETYVIVNDEDIQGVLIREEVNDE